MKKIWKIVLGAGLVALVGVIAFSAVALAQDPTPTPTPAKPGVRGWITDYATRLRDALAARLGIAPEALDELSKGAFDDVIGQALSEGIITQEQADQLRQCAPSGFADLMGRGKGGRFGGRMGPRGFMMPGQPMLDTDIIAEKLGMTVDELKAELKDGKTVAELAQAKGVELQVIVDALVASQAERLQQAVTNGRITQEQADQMLNAMKERLTKILAESRPWVGGHGPGWRFDQGFGRGGRWLGSPKQTAPQPTPLPGQSQS